MYKIAADADEYLPLNKSGKLKSINVKAVYISVHAGSACLFPPMFPLPELSSYTVWPTTVIHSPQPSPELFLLPVPRI